MTTDMPTVTSSDVKSDLVSEKPPVLAEGLALNLGEGITAAGPSWQDQDDILRSMWADNQTPEEISVALARSVAAIMTRAARLGLPRRSAPGRKRGYKRSEVKRKVMAPAGTRVRVVLPQDIEEDTEERAAPQIMMRVCLMCLNKFQSQGRHNRICPSCKGSADYATGSCTPDFAFKVIS